MKKWKVSKKLQNRITVSLIALLFIPCNLLSKAENYSGPGRTNIPADSKSEIEQDTATNPVFLGLKPYYGYIIPHSKYIRHVSYSNPFGIELDYGWILTSQSDWERCNCYTRAGISTSFINFDNPDILGSAINLMLFVEPYITNPRKNNWMSIGMGAGPSYLTKVYDEKTNPDNLFFSTRLSFIIYFDIIYNFRLNDHANGKIFAKYNHISNGSVSQPNKGMNFPTLGLGMDYALKPPSFPERKPVPVKQKKIIFSAAVFGTLRRSLWEEFNDLSNHTIGYGLLVKGRKKISKINALNSGFELFLDDKVQEKSEGQKEHRQLSWLIGHDLLLGRFMFSQHWGTYLNGPHYDDIFFQRYSLTFNLVNHLHIGVNLKAHRQVAHNFNLHLSYDLN